MPGMWYAPCKGCHCQKAIIVSIFVVASSVSTQPEAVCFATGCLLFTWALCAAVVSEVKASNIYSPAFISRNQQERSPASERPATRAFSTGWPGFVQFTQEAKWLPAHAAL